MAIRHGWQRKQGGRGLAGRLVGRQASKQDSWSTGNKQALDEITNTQEETTTRVRGLSVASAETGTTIWR